MTVGVALGAREGGSDVGTRLGTIDGAELGTRLGAIDGAELGTRLGVTDGASVGARVAAHRIVQPQPVNSAVRIT